MMMGKRRFTHFILFLVSFAGASCGVRKELAENLAEKEADNSAIRQELAFGINRGEVRLLPWKSAIKLLKENNIEIRRTEIRIARIKEERDEQWKTWLPRISAFGNLQASLAELGDLSLSDPSFTVVAPLNIPNPLTEQARAFENALSYLESVSSAKVNYRRQVVRLYTLYSEADRLAQQASENRESDELGINSAIGKLERSASLRERSGNISRQLAQLLNLPGEQLFPEPDTRPKIDYSSKIDGLKPGENYGELALRLTAYQIEAALLREKGIKLRRWPALNLTAASPAVFDSRRADNADFFDADRITLFGGLNDSYDFTGRDAEAVESAEQNTQFVRENLRIRLDQEIREWNRLQGRYKQVLLTKKIAKERLERIRKGSNGASAVSGLVALREAQTKITSISQLKEQMDLEIWVWDESKWN